MNIRTEMLFIDPGACIDCGACVDECPVDAIVPPEDITPATEPFVELNAAYFRDRPPVVSSSNEGAPGIGTTALGSLRVAIVGSGPSACYTADALCGTKGLDVEVTILEKLPTPGGLVRYGVAPDHAATKGISTLFARTLGRKSCTVHLNTEVGVHVTHDELLRHHHAVIYASGAEGDRRLGIPGEDLPGTVAARDFVLWYNGHPDHADRTFDLSDECAVVVGNGNVALDVARILTSDVSRLTGTDITENALEVLASCRIRKVVVLGRRGPEHAAFSTAELLGLGHLPGVDVTASHSFDPAAADALTRIRASILDRYHNTEPVPGNRRIHLQFFRSPIEVIGASATDGLRVEVTGTALDGESEIEDMTAGLVVRSVGFRGRPLPGVPFDERRGVLPNRNGAVHDPATGTPVRGVYTAGWLKRGPSGVIGSNRSCSEQTVAELVSDFAAGRLGVVEEDPREFGRLLAQRHADRVDLAGWKRLDAHERKLGRTAGRPRVKVVDRLGMVDVALGRQVSKST
ncbi:ferredoxin--NADP(+) reductase [Rhodococcus triatomae BKS 15-14]|nr:ferredoxin--NADP(+) reductase [Rhodococcus triatomae BKS 15-14]